MRKIVINKCFGGFSISDAAIERYAELKGLTLYREHGDFSRILGPTYWTVPEDQRPKKIEKWHLAPLEDRIAYNEDYVSKTISTSNIKRDDPVLIQVVEELGEKANGMCAKLIVIEIPDDVEWEISEYDGMETVEEKHRSWG